MGFSTSAILFWGEAVEGNDSHLKDCFNSSMCTMVTAGQQIPTHLANIGHGAEPQALHSMHPQHAISKTLPNCDVWKQQRNFDAGAMRGVFCRGQYGTALLLTKGDRVEQLMMPLSRSPGSGSLYDNTCERQSVFIVARLPKIPFGVVNCTLLKLRTVSTVPECPVEAHVCKFVCSLREPCAHRAPG